MVKRFYFLILNMKIVCKESHGGLRINIPTAEITYSIEEKNVIKTGPPVSQYPGIWGSPKETSSSFVTLKLKHAMWVHPEDSKYLQSHLQSPLKESLSSGFQKTTLHPHRFQAMVLSILWKMLVCQLPPRRVKIWGGHTEPLLET